MNQPVKVLQVAAVDITVKKLLLPLIERLAAEGYEVHIACANGRYAPELRSRGYAVHPVAIERRVTSFSNARALWQLYRLMRKERFDIVHVHTMVAATLARLAAWAARVPIIIYTAHGFYFHERMSGLVRRPVIWLERQLCRTTHMVFTQSGEDATAAVSERICPEARVLQIGNGVDVEHFAGARASADVRRRLGLSPEDRVVGFVGRLVREKGILELVEAMKTVVEAVPQAMLLIVGDTLGSDRDRKAKRVLRDAIERNGLGPRVVFAGFVEDVASTIGAMELLALPSHREGMPRTIIEAMAGGKPVVATDIRGCREEVVHDSTGLLVPVNDPPALAAAITRILLTPELGREMGAKGRQRARELFDERVAIDRQVQSYARLVSDRVRQGASLAGRLAKKRYQLWMKRAIDILLSSVSLTFLSVPFLIIAVLIKSDSRGSVFFRQERIGKDGKPFRIWKFRTMEEGAMHRGLGANVARGDPRITRVGRRLRDWGLDELPQLVNVLRGEMSIVGPRATLPYQVELYDDYERQRLLTSPGITSLPLIRGRNLLSWKERIDLDIWYLCNWSLWLDLKVIFRTFWVVLVSRQGIYGPEGVNDDFVSSIGLGRRQT